jgi:ketosteroid isomerase-like protein
MDTKMAGALSSYYAAVNTRDTERVLAPFADDAIVKDQGEEHCGRDAIRAWMRTTMRKYGRLKVEPSAAAESGRVTVVTCTV